jgi:hypothetical protein
MLGRILSLVSSYEKKRDRKIDQTSGEDPEGRSKEFISSVDFVSTKQEIPDPWSGDWNDYWANSINKSE